MKSGWPGVSMTLRWQLPSLNENTWLVRVWCRSFSSGSVLLILVPSAESPWRLVTLWTKASASMTAVLPLFPCPKRAMFRIS